jgi:uncharacterized membrane protein
MQKASRYIFILLKNTFIISAIGLLLAWIAREGSFFQIGFGYTGLYGTFLTVLLFILHILFIIFALIFNNDKPGR